MNIHMLWRIVFGEFFQKPMNQLNEAFTIVLAVVVFGAEAFTPSSCLKHADINRRSSRLGPRVLLRASIYYPEDDGRYSNNNDDDNDASSSSSTTIRPPSSGPAMASAPPPPPSSWTSSSTPVTTRITGVCSGTSRTSCCSRPSHARHRHTPPRDTRVRERRAVLQSQRPQYRDRGRGVRLHRVHVPPGPLEFPRGVHGGRLKGWDAKLQ